MKLINPFGFDPGGRWEDISLLLLRITFGGLMFLHHGLGKFHRFFSGEEVKFVDFLGLGPKLSLGLAAFAEAGCALLVVLGLFTRLASIPLVITMIVGLAIAHANDPFRKWEMALLYAIVFLVLFLKGAGKYSIDEYIH